MSDASLVKRLLAVADEILEADCRAIEDGHQPNAWHYKCEYACRDAAAAIKRLTGAAAGLTESEKP
jgi:hypothetical protein